ncbi:hypothetical protein R69927_01923 [Paraburkholderia domus]|jgi:hypothetical protein|uniref:DUF4148 domain-containing protein n=1 Tax=Paraburkholderia domus TaxID=2793075 RepID=A0A9N8MSI2_9BURK|nr:DUF4148 domain-containing protein [Paraburkholderia domus]MBK5048994.1 DUF4148 domain-containing protein [Burkholderia sp. R-70006]MBK5061295.1 DUF4148 domain-containing protein [Burkholderia sp. R-70199]MBK5086338.1 DUF4148 domain-containing protein [Burkholderia sp. R-69927]MBK5120383.1 DUF4148 domain-containing protein [Burkholderia sp. R-69980]MBK5165825.1 DUF4148 domain-containing protein [Burkholderia sp. R-70211]MBK5179903.1 DUF4148 domain-containing protein [Burkholderia sp. R-6974
MKSITTLILTSALLLSPAVQAQGLTRAEVKQQLIEAQANGLGYITDTSYPAIHPSFEHKVKAQPSQSSYGGVPDGSQQSSIAPHGLPMPHGNPHCVGPVSFCNIYAGS